MSTDTKVSVKSKYGELELVTSTAILLLDKDDIITLQLPNEMSNWKLNFSFTETDDKPERSFRNVVADDGLSIDFYFNKWYSSSWIENSEPIVFTPESEKFEMLVKVRTTGEKKNLNRRYITINIWKKNLIS